MTKIIVLLKNGKPLKMFSNRDNMLDWIENNTKCDAEIMFYDFRYANLIERIIYKLIN